MISDQMAIVAGCLAGIIFLVGISANILIREAKRHGLDDRVLRAVWGEPARESAATGIAASLHALGERVRRGSRFYSQKDISYLQGLILAAGHNPKKLLPIVLGMKLLIMFPLPVVAAGAAFLLIESTQFRFVAIGVGVIAGIMGPEFLLGILRRPYTAALQRGTPDALDLLVVCSEAGMGLESALERVSQELFHSNRPMAVALSSLLDDLRVLPDRRAAFANFGSRSGVEGLQRMATMLAFNTGPRSAMRCVR